MRTGAVIAYNKDGKASLIIAGADLKKQRSVFRELADKARSDKGYERVEWFVTPHRAVRRRPPVRVAVVSDDTDIDLESTNQNEAEA